MNWNKGRYPDHRVIRLLSLLLVFIGVLGCQNENVQRDESETDSYAMPADQRSGFAWPQGIRGAVSLTFDDARTSQVDVGLPILDAHSVKATFYVSPEPLKTRVAAWKKAIAKGHEIGNHSLRHPCTGNFPWARHKALEDYTLAQMERELKAANATIESTLGVQPATFAYPCGQKYVGRGTELNSYVPLVAEMFLAGRGWLDEGTNDPSFCDSAQLMGMELDGLDPTQAKALIDKALETGTWLVFCGHEIGNGQRQTVRSDTLRAICQYAQDPDNGIWIDTVENIAGYVEHQRDVR